MQNDLNFRKKKISDPYNIATKDSFGYFTFGNVFESLIEFFFSSFWFVVATVFLFQC